MQKCGIWFLCLFGLNLALGMNYLRASGDYELHMLNVGQGDAFLFVTPDEHHVLIDGGPGRSVLMELGETLPLLWKDIDLLVLSHPHLDHMEGLIHVLERFEVGTVLMSAPSYDSLVYGAFMDAVADTEAELYFAEAGMDFCVGSFAREEYEGANMDSALCEGLFLDVLYPFKDMTGQEMENINNASPVIMASFDFEDLDSMRELKLLFTGDAEEEVEEELLVHFCAKDVQDLGSTFEEGLSGFCPQLEANILKAGHHGSRTSSSLEFLEAVKPEIMLISAGKDNSFGHPHIETLEKTQSLGIGVRRADLEGRVSLSF